MERCLARWQTYAPNLTRANILKKKALTPLDIERKLVNMALGGIFMGRSAYDQIEYFRLSFRLGFESLVPHLEAGRLEAKRIQCAPNLEDVPKLFRKGLKFVFVSDVSEVLEIALDAPVARRSGTRVGSARPVAV